ncbi:MAG: hypothetical protein OZ923_07320, partial [Comamonadaceae bacterium]|nr:hypothetical protein [Comamonadaceae bacterium]
NDLLAPAPHATQPAPHESTTRQHNQQGLAAISEALHCISKLKAHPRTSEKNALTPPRTG